MRAVRGSGATLTGMSVAEVTGFGAAWADPARTASVLRAKAVAAGVHGVAASATDTVDLVAAVVGAHVWAASLGAQALSEAARFGQRERQAAATILARASGLRPPARAAGQVVLEWAAYAPGVVPDHVLTQVARAVSWAEEVVDADCVGDALAAAAEDLLGCGSEMLRAAAMALLNEADRA